MPIFNSLGSNYSLEFIFKSIFSRSGRHSRLQAKQKLATHYKGHATLTYKGREALELALKSSDLPSGSRVGINGFTCYVVYAAVINAGYEPVFIDVASGQLNFGLNELKQTYDKYDQLNAIIVQNTLGYPAEVDPMLTFCKEKKVLVIEDLAHSLGAHYSGNIEVGLVGEMTMLSFSQDKPLDVIAGGALIDRRQQARAVDSLRETSFGLRTRNRLYPFWSYFIRKTYSIGLGRYLHAVLKKLHLLSTPMGSNRRAISNISSKAASLLVGRWHNRQVELEHRRRMAEIYKSLLPKKLLFEEVSGSNASYLRFPIKVNDRPALVTYLKQYQIYIGDTWYDAPIGPKRYMEKTSYTIGFCPRSEELAETIVNLPTHINVDQKAAEFIAGKVNEWLKSQ